MRVRSCVTVQKDRGSIPGTGGTQLIRVGVARDPAQAAPVSGSWYGDSDAYAGMQVTVQVRRVGLRR